MTLRRSLLTGALLAAAAVAFLGTVTIELVRSSDRQTMLERAAEAAVSEPMRAACEANPNWFLAGPRELPPTKEEQAQPDADVFTKRPDTKPRPYEFFAYDEEFKGISTAAPRFPDALRLALKQGNAAVSESWNGPDGAGVEVARWTAWRGSECAIFLFRAAPPAHQWLVRGGIFAGMFAASFLAVFLVGLPTERRVAHVATVMRDSARNSYAAIVPPAGDDEVASIGVLFNDAAADIRQRSTEIKEQQEAIRRISGETSDDLVTPLAAVPERLADVLRSVSLTPAVREQLLMAVCDSQTLVLRGANLIASAKLRDRDGGLKNEPVDLTTLIEKVTARYAMFANACGVTLSASVPDADVAVIGDEAMFDLALTNVVDNAIRYTKPGGTAVINLDVPVAGKFVLTVSDDGVGMNDALLKYVNGVRRFRGDERRKHREDEVGLGLAVVHEVTGRARIGLTFRRRDNGGIEVKWSS